MAQLARAVRGRRADSGAWADSCGAQMFEFEFAGEESPPRSRSRSPALASSPEGSCSGSDSGESEFGFEYVTRFSLVENRYQEQLWVADTRARQIALDPLGSHRGCAYYDELTQGWPPGPATPAAFADWPSLQVAALFGPRVPNRASFRQRLESLLAAGSIVHTDYSGMQGPEMAMRMQHQALLEFGVRLPSRYMTTWRACDTLPTCQRVAMSGKYPPRHMFPGIVERLPPQHQRALRHLDPQPTTKEHDRR